jgi:hypothetical protein
MSLEQLIADLKSIPKEEKAMENELPTNLINFDFQARINRAARMAEKAESLRQEKEENRVEERALTRSISIAVLLTVAGIYLIAKVAFNA